MEPTDGKRIDDFDIAVINLDRRPDRMSHLYNHAPIMFRRFPAIDGTNLSKHYFQFSELLDTIRNQNRVLGEVGCSLSHYSLWKEHIERCDGHGRASGHEHLLIFEDDVMFTDRSREQYKRMTREISHGVVEKGFQFDLIYVGGQWTSHYDIDGSNAPYFKKQRKNLSKHIIANLSFQTYTNVAISRQRSFKENVMSGIHHYFAPRVLM
jgi:GR25 family glycosyltransferase involved in LPS biosynthesis